MPGPWGWVQKTALYWITEQKNGFKPLFWGMTLKTENVP